MQLDAHYWPGKPGKGIPVINHSLSVTELNRFIKTLVSNNSVLKHLNVEGEISNFKQQSSGHLYFHLKDEEGRIACVMFKSDARKLQLLPSDGMHVIVRGRVDLYERSGQLQLYVQSIAPVGMGDLYQAFETMKRRLEARGWFKTDQKKALPETINTVGIVTSPTGAAIHDLMTVIHRRDPSIKILLAPALVQGEQAAASIASAVQTLDARGDCDVLIVGRGGGSMEDLWAFNEMSVAKAVHLAGTPVVSAVGHETDFTICDFTADIRAATPSEAGELVSEDKQVRQLALETLNDQLIMDMEAILFDLRNQLETRIQNLENASPQNAIRQDNITVDHLEDRLKTVLVHQLKSEKQNVKAMGDHLTILNPQNVLKRGYALVEGKDGSIIENTRRAREAGELMLCFKDGSVEAEVKQEESWQRENIKPK